MLVRIISQCGAPSCTLPKKAFLSHSVSARKEYIWKLNWKESLQICSENCQGVPCFHWQSRNRMMNTFIIANITPICNRFKKKPSLSLHLGTYLKEELITYILLCFESYQGVSYSHTGRIDKNGMVNTLLMINVNHICKRLFIR